MGDSTTAMADEQAETPKNFKDLGLRDELVEACDVVGWRIPTKIQVDTIPFAIDGRDVIGLSRTGWGKTGAFALPILHALFEKPRPFFACVISPTRELAIQIAEQFESLGSGIGVECAVLVGGAKMIHQSISLGKSPHIVVGTPGRLLDHLTNTKGFSLRTIKYLVLDEADRLLTPYYEKAVDAILKVVSADRRTFLFSATMTMKVAKFQRACLRNPVKIEDSSMYSIIDTCQQQCYMVLADHKDCYLVYTLTQIIGSTSMVFTQTCKSTQFLSLFLRKLGLEAIPINHQMNQPKRLEALNSFKGGACNILICTDVASIGLDIPLVDAVINYNIPRNSKDYIHRVGKTAHAGRSGVIISLVDQYETEWYLRMEQVIGIKAPEHPAENAQVLLAYSEHVSDAKRICNEEMKSINADRKRRRTDDDDDDDDDNPDKYVPAKKSNTGMKISSFRYRTSSQKKKRNKEVKKLSFTLDDLRF